ncbi:MAG TPA: phosphotransacetylase family protein [Anaerolineales bacterium]|nr:phosphotransacetylase family protein [Anaerolineales bacterium]
MKSIYITSVDTYSGKTALTLVLGKYLQSKGHKLGYLKPLSFQPRLTGGKVTDEDAIYAKEVLGLSNHPWDLSPVVVTTEFLLERMQVQDGDDLIEKITAKADELSEGVDIMLYEGGASLREGYALGLPATMVSQKLNTPILAVVKYRDKVHLLDDAITAKTRLGDQLGGIVINRAPSDAVEFITKDAAPFLKSRGIPLFGILPETRALEALTLQEISDVLGAELLTEAYNPDILVESLMVGAMTADAALSRFRKMGNKAVITGGDRSDIQLAALETSTSCLILTGNLHPSPLVIKQAEDLGVAIFLVPTSTMETVEKIESVFGRTRMGQHAKLDKFEKLVHQYLDLNKLFKAFDID